MGSPQLPNSVSDWKAGFRGIVKPHLYEVVFAGPGWNTVLQASNADQSTTRELIIHCEAAKFPAGSLGTQPNRVYGPVREFAYERIYSGDLGLTFRMDEEMGLRTIFENWHNIIHDRQSGDWAYYDDYTCDIYVFQYPAQQSDGETRDKKAIYGVRVEECFPKSLGEVEVGYDQRDTYMKQEVEFAFRRWQEIPRSEL